MSFRCGFCHTQTQPHEKATRVVTETRKAIYPFRENAHSVIIEGKREPSHDPGGLGIEIAKEVLACPKCAPELSVSQ